MAHTMSQLPKAFEERLQEIIPKEHYSAVWESFFRSKVLSVRINTLKISCDRVKEYFKKEGVRYSQISWMADALILDGIDAKELGFLNLAKEGEVYIQNLSSMLIPLILDPKPGESVLDMCAAPGSKTSQMAAMMKNEGVITAIENVKSRFYKLKSVVELLGAKNVNLKLMDARRFRSDILFDKILLDAPCSSEGRFNESTSKSFAYWSPRKIKEMRKKQKGLLRSAARLLKPGGALVYSTCTFSPEENEEVVNWVLKKQEAQLELLPISLKNLFCYPPVLRWNNKEFDQQLKKSVRILPTEEMAGFFIAKLRKTK